MAGSAVQVTAVGAGLTLITASLDGVSASVAVAVEARVPTRLALAEESLAFTALGDTASFAVTVFDQVDEELADAEVEWSSSAPDVAMVSSNGLVTALSNGVAELVVRSGAVSGVVAVTIRQQAVSFTFRSDSLDLLIRQESGLRANPKDANGHEVRVEEIPGTTVSWVSRDPAVADISADGEAPSTQVAAFAAGQTWVSVELGGYADSLKVVVKPRTLVGIKMSPASTTTTTFTALGDTARFTVTLLDDRGDEWPGTDVIWSTSNAAVATVSSEGLVTAVGNGVASVVAFAGAVAEASSVVVRQEASTVTVQPSSLQLVTGQLGSLTAKAADANGNEVVGGDAAGFSWESGNAAVATVSNSGQVTAVGSGTTDVTATLDGVSGSATVTVEGPKATTLTLSTDNATTPALGAQLQLTATVLDQVGTLMVGAPVTWSTSDASVATVSSSGLVTSVGNGTARIVAQSGAVADTATMVVRQVVFSVTVEPDSLDLVHGSLAGVLRATARDANGHEVGLGARAAFSWESGDVSVVAVAVAGDTATVKGVGVGTTHVKATVGGVSDSTVITVSASVATTLTLDVDSLALTALDATSQLTAQGFDQNGAARIFPIAWFTSDPTVATVSSGGLVTAVGNGRAWVVARSGSVEDTASVTVRQVVSSVTVEPDSLALVQGSVDGVLMATATDANGHRVDVGARAAFSWESGDVAVATVAVPTVWVAGDTATVTGVGVGTTHVKATVGGVSDSTVITVSASVATRLTLDVDSLAFTALDASRQLTAQGFDQNGSPRRFPITWSTSDTTVATVSSSGLVTAVGNGTAGVVARSGSVADTASVTVRQRASTVTIEPESLSLAIGQVGSLTAFAKDANDNQVRLLMISGATFAWESLDSTVAKVTSADGHSGQITAVGSGTTYVKAALDGASDSIAVSVGLGVPTTITLDADSATLTALDATRQLVATVLNQGGVLIPGAPVSWSTSDTTVATVSSSGLVTAVGNGTAQVVARSDSVADTASVTVRQRASTVTIEPESLFLAIGQVGSLTAFATDANDNQVRLLRISGATFAWESLDSTVAKVTSADGHSGQITAVGSGTTYVKAALDGASDSVAVSVGLGVPTTITLDADSATLTALDATRQLVATVLNQGGSLDSGCPGLLVNFGHHGGHGLV